jgi:hypothetical protein
MTKQHPHALGPLMRQHIMAGVPGGAHYSPYDPGSRVRERRVAKFSQSPSGACPQQPNDLRGGLTS